MSKKKKEEKDLSDVEAIVKERMDVVEEKVLEKFVSFRKYDEEVNGKVTNVFKSKLRNQFKKMEELNGYLKMLGLELKFINNQK